MKKVKNILSLGLVIFLGCFSLHAIDLSVRIFSEKQIDKLQFTTVLGAYKLSDGNSDFSYMVLKGESVELEAVNDAILLSQGGKELGRFPSLAFDGEGLKAIFEIKALPVKAKEQRFYDDHLEVSIDNGHFVLINVADLENYVAGAVQSEVHGSSDKLDFFKIQAIISRTYAMSNINKHIKEGYNLCDGVHCQVYSSRNNQAIILTAAVETEGVVIVDSTKKIITASFYSNSGGETANSEDVWTVAAPYLRSVKDSFSLSMRNAYWEKSMPEQEWLNFLQTKYHYKINDPIMRDSALHFSQEEGRKVYFPSKIPLKFIRRDLGLRSSFFSVLREGDKVILKGRGYGHGVGLSQEGAIKMIDSSYSIEEVIKFYYTNVELLHVNEIPSDELGD